MVQPSEDGPGITDNAITDATTGDIDKSPDSDPLFIDAINGNTALVGQPVAGSTGGTFTVNTDGTWSFNPGLDFQNLNTVETRDTTITYRVSDGQGGFATATITVTGSADAPVALGNIPAVNGVDGQPIAPLSTAAAFNNPANSPLTFSATGLPAGLAIDPLTGTITATLASDASVKGPYVVNVTATSPDGSTSTVPVQINATKPAPLAVNDKATTPINTTVMLTPLANDTDPDGDKLAI